MLPRSTLNSVKERGSNGALRSHLFAKERTRRGGSRRSFTEGGTLNHQLRRALICDISRSSVCFLQFDENAPQLYGLFFICSAEMKRADTQSLHRQIGREPR